MKFCLRILSLLLLVGGTLTQDGFDLADALDDVATTPPKLKPKTTEKPKSDGGLDLADALKPGPTPKMDNPPKVPPKSGGGGGSFDDSDLFDVGAGDYKPDGGRSGGRAVDPGNDPQGGPDQPQDPDNMWDQVLKMFCSNMPA
ncbi:CD99 molecule, partial [Nematolebias whitei]|uniref:CD99 molecule n=1 Tax=Nematolebias whitei TaxID=451745 RepID=UPI00189B4BA5